jgi:16S rRNA (uracil1498-N3)-methyltransferase
MPARLFLDHAIEAHTPLTLTTGAARHVQVLRLQPGDPLVLFNGQGGEWQATVRQMGRSEVVVDVGAHDAADRELPQRVTLAIGMPANERMDTLVEKATELGVAVLQPLLCERSVLRLSGERAERLQAH